MKIRLFGRNRRDVKLHAEFDMDVSIPPAIIRINGERLYKYSHFSYTTSKLKQHHYVEADVVDVKMEVVND